MEYYSAIKRNETGSFVEMWMDLETVIQSEVSQKEKNKNQQDTGTPKFRAALLTRTPTSLHLKYPRKEKNG